MVFDGKGGSNRRKSVWIKDIKKVEQGLTKGKPIGWL